MSDSRTGGREQFRRGVEEWRDRLSEAQASITDAKSARQEYESQVEERVQEETGRLAYWDDIQGEEYDQLSRAIDHTQARHQKLQREFQAWVQEFDLEYKTLVLGILEAFEGDIRTSRVAEIVGCSHSHAAKFEYDDETETARKKDWWSTYEESKLSPAKRDKIVEEDGECARCGVDGNLVVHHIIPANQDGSADRTNLATLCSDCHEASHGHDVQSGEVIYDDREGFWKWVDAEYQTTLDFY
ncbi:HNH endonuclease [Natrinema sp. 1APR25-10V2]|uniref:HNH endonuclease n=1 Tax=Natrinema sp. 1APR25-10V2 TaxID=2951081 RepID=UPI00287720A0|nr:HNH endonuclease [Natrinema sp. 1APR25-10V2]MDS0473782.1 HNH endonuclease [Natrinema sp. 1APR25-10V2]